MSRPTCGSPTGEPVGTGVVLPGRGYPPAAPGLAYAGYVLRAAGWRVRDVWWDPPANGSLSLEGEVAWVGDQLASATDGVDGPVLVVGKSLGTYGARLAAEREYEAIWLTPLLTDPVLVEGIRANPARQLLVGGTADRLWDADVAASLAADGCDVLQIDGARPRPGRPHGPGPLGRGPRRDHPRDGRLRGRVCPFVRVATPPNVRDTRSTGYHVRASRQCRRSPNESSAMLARSSPWPSVTARSKDALTSFSASSRPTQLAPSTDLPGSSSL